VGIKTAKYRPQRGRERETPTTETDIVHRRPQQREAPSKSMARERAVRRFHDHYPLLSRTLSVILRSAIRYFHVLRPLVSRLPAIGFAFARPWFRI